MKYKDTNQYILLKMYVHLNSYDVRNLRTFRGTLRFTRISDKFKNSRNM